MAESPNVSPAHALESIQSESRCFPAASDAPAQRREIEGGRRTLSKVASTGVLESAASPVLLVSRPSLGRSSSAATIATIEKGEARARLSNSSGILARRDRLFKSGLQVDTGSAIAAGRPKVVQTSVSLRDSLRTTPRERRVDSKTTRRFIRRQAIIADVYKLGDEVMPSCHSGMTIQFATPVGKEEQVVIKVRDKRTSFLGRADEANWREQTELMMNLQGCKNVAQIIDVMEDDLFYYVVMEKAGGLDLCEMRGKDGTIEMNDVKEILRQLLAGVAELHDRGFVHKDLKLENVMLDRSGGSGAASPDLSTTARSPALSTGCPSPMEPSSPCAVKLIDFDTMSPKSTKPHEVFEIVGTNGYIAPEAYKGNYTPASDIFAIGVIAYSLVTDKFPFDESLFDDVEGENRVGNPKMTEISQRVVSAHIDWNHFKFKAEPGAKKLISKMLKANEHVRPTATSALNDPWLTGAEPVSPTSAKRVPMRLSQTAVSRGDMSPLLKNSESFMSNAVSIGSASRASFDSERSNASHTSHTSHQRPGSSSLASAGRAMLSSHG